MTPRTLVVHCSATRWEQDIGVAEIERWHLERGWSGIGYHYVIRRTGELEIGRPTWVPGAHVRGHNHDTLGVCLIGGIDEAGAPEDNFTVAQRLTLARLIRRLKLPVKGHRDFPGVRKACPCIDVQEWIDTGMPP